MSDVSTPQCAGGTTYTVYRDVAHPWTGEPGWDILFIQREHNGILTDCEKRGWKLWCVGESLRGSPRAVFLKPHRLPVGNNATQWNEPMPWPEIEV